MERHWKSVDGGSFCEIRKPRQNIDEAHLQSCPSRTNNEAFFGTHTKLVDVDAKPYDIRKCTISTATRKIDTIHRQKIPSKTNNINFKYEQLTGKNNEETTMSDM